MAQSYSHIVYWGLPDTTAALMAKRLSGVDPDNGTLVLDIAQVESALSKRSDAQACLFYDRGETLLATAEQNSTDLTATLDKWKTQVQALLALQRSDRRRVRIFETEHFQRFLPLGLSRLNLPADALPDLPVPASPKALSLLIAQYLLRQERAIEELANELEAATQTLSNDGIRDVMPSSEDVIEAITAQRQQLTETAEVDLKAVDAVRERFIGEQAKQQKQIERLTEKLGADAQARDLMLDEMKSLEMDYAAKETELAEVRDRALADEARYEDQIRSLENEIERIWESASMRLTAPLRKVVDLLRKPRQ